MTEISEWKDILFIFLDVLIDSFFVFFYSFCEFMLLDKNRSNYAWSLFEVYEEMYLWRELWFTFDTSKNYKLSFPFAFMYFSIKRRAWLKGITSSATLWIIITLLRILWIKSKFEKWSSLNFVSEVTSFEKRQHIEAIGHWRITASTLYFAAQ